MIKQLLRQFVGDPEPAVKQGVSAANLPLCISVLLVEMAAIDDDFDDGERRHIIDTLRRRFDLSTTDAQELLDMATQARDESSDIWKFTNIINESCSREEKGQLIEEIWRVVFVDGYLDGHEDNLAHKMGRLLNLTHPEIIEAKLRARDAAGN
jgi:uncharacterized tellurite resistance protein B-like protein